MVAHNYKEKEEEEKEVLEEEEDAPGCICELSLSPMERLFFNIWLDDRYCDFFGKIMAK